jgi:phenylalanyl-tRNA synthetase beta chain
MRVPLEWLREYCDPDLDVHGIEERLTMTGTKVEAIHHHGVRSPGRFLVGRVLSCERHPDADRLSVCQVDLGLARSEGPATIVCGAHNVAAGQTVAVACPGAVMPDGSEIRRAKLRGVVSEGMILAEQELDIGAGRDGILVLDELMSAGQLGELALPGTQFGERRELPPPGTPLAEVLPLGGEVIELEITSNRPDCLGVYGVARELHAATGAPLAPSPWEQDSGSEGALPTTPAGGSPAEVSVECPDLCPRFTARVFENVTLGQSPPWLKARLSAAGQRPINNVVDITNYVMLLTGQPLHAFDLDRVAGARLVVRRARDGEEVETLDGQTRTLDAQMVVIEDAEGPTSIAGLIGGARSEVGEDTTRVLMEVANWNGPNIHRTGWALGLRSEASARFEKGLAPEQCDHAQALATRLMLDLCGATVLPGTIDEGECSGERSDAGHPPAATPIRLREARVEAILGVPIPLNRQREILRALDFDTSDAEDGLDVTVPALRRADVTREADLIEEVARIDGVEKLPATLPRHRPAGRLSLEQRLRRRAVDALVGRGLYETVGWTFTSPATLERLRLAPGDPRRAGALELENPLSEEHALLRTTLLGSLLDSAANNVAHGHADLRLLEVGTVFAAGAPAGTGDGDSSENDPAARVRAYARRGPRETCIHEHRALGILLSGKLAPATWREPDPPRAGLYAVKAVLDALGEALRVTLSARPLADSDAHPFLHPGRAAELLAGEQPLGWFGELHPLVQGWEIPGAAIAEIDLDALVAAAGGGAETQRYSDLISFPVLREDIAVTLPAEVPAAEALAVVRDAGGSLLHDARVFDVYTGPQVGEGRRSLALALAFRASDRTLADEDVAPLRERILAAVRERLGGELRG